MNGDKEEGLAVAQLLDDYVTKHENDGGSQNFMERNAICMLMLHHFAMLIRELASREA